MDMPALTGKVILGAGFEVGVGQDPLLLEQRERPVHGGGIHPGHPAPDPAGDRGRADVALGSHHLQHDGLPLGSELQTLGPELIQDVGCLDVGQDVVDPNSVIAVEVFLHHPAEVVLSLLEKLAAISQHIINIDWSEPWSRPTSPHVWVHDYASLYAKRGLQCVTLCLPEKIEGKQQKLFIAAHQLSQTLLKLEAQGLAAPPPAAEPATDWMGQVCQATEDLLSRTQPGSTIILVNDDQWGNEHAIADRRILPFLEKGGVYAGPPSDDLQASQELDRMLQGGAGYIVFAWNSFWWLDHYAAFHHQLRQRFHCVLNNECLVIFELKTPNPNDPSIQ